MPPTNMVPTPIIEGGLEAVEIAMQHNTFKEHIRECKHHKEAINTTKKIITGAFEENKSHDLNKTHTGFMSVSIHQIFQHLHDTHGNIIELDLQ